MNPDHYVHQNLVDLHFYGGPLGGKVHSMPAAKFHGEIRVALPAEPKFIPDVGALSPCELGPRLGVYKQAAEVVKVPCGCGIVGMEYDGEA